MHCVVHNLFYFKKKVIEKSNGGLCPSLATPLVPPPHWRKITFKKKRDAVIQAMIEVDVEEWDDFLLA